MIEKKCYNCKHNGFCAIHQKITKMGGMLITHIVNPHPTGENGYQMVINLIAQNCINFKSFEDTDNG